MMAGDTMRVVIIDDHPLYREGVAHALAADPDLEIVAEGETAEDAVRHAGALRPDVMVLDLNIPGGGLAALRGIAAVSPETRIVILTAHTADEHLDMAFGGGAMSYVLKGVTARELAKIIRDAFAGQGYVSPALGARLMASRSGRPAATRPADPLDELTARERQILTLVAKGYPNKQIADELCLAEKSVKNAMTIIMQKLDVKNRTEAALLAKSALAESRLR